MCVRNACYTTTKSNFDFSDFFFVYLCCVLFRLHLIEFFVSSQKKNSNDRTKQDILVPFNGSHHVQHTNDFNLARERRKTPKWMCVYFIMIFLSVAMSDLDLKWQRWEDGSQRKFDSKNNYQKKYPFFCSLTLFLLKFSFSHSDSWRIGCFFLSVFFWIKIVMRTPSSWFFFEELNASTIHTPIFYWTWQMSGHFFVSRFFFRRCEQEEERKNCKFNTKVVSRCCFKKRKWIERKEKNVLPLPRRWWCEKWV